MPKCPPSASVSLPSLLCRLITQTRPPTPNQHKTTVGGQAFQIIQEVNGTKPQGVINRRNQGNTYVGGENCILSHRQLRLGQQGPGIGLHTSRGTLEKTV